MAYRKINDASLTAIADAIREKGGTSEALTFPDDFVTAIQGISSGSGVDFAVTAYPDETDLLSATPPDNTIGVVTTTEITSWIFTPREPEGSPGKVWIRLGDDSGVSLDVSGESKLVVYPIYARQYVSGAWVSVIAKSYQNDAWNDWVKDIVIVPNMVEYDTPRWIIKGIDNNATNDPSNLPTVTIDTTGIQVQSKSISDTKHDIVLVEVDRNLRGLTKMKIVGQVYDPTNTSGKTNVRIGLFSDGTGDTDTFITGYAYDSMPKGTYTINQEYDITGLPDIVWFGIKHFDASSTAHSITTTLTSVQLVL